MGPHLVCVPSSSASREGWGERKREKQPAFSGLVIARHLAAITLSLPDFHSLFKHYYRHSQNYLEQRKTGNYFKCPLTETGQIN